MDSIPLKMPQCESLTVNEDVEVTIPDYLRILQETEVSLEFVTLTCTHETEYIYLIDY